MNSKTIQELTETLKNKGLKTTPTRLSVLSTLASAKKPLSIQEIFEKNKDSKIDLATVYRIIQIFKKLSIINEINLEHSHGHYELNLKKHHHHIICEKCEKITDISECNLERLEKEVLIKTGFQHINRHSLEFFGICKPCSKK